MRINKTGPLMNVKDLQKLLDVDPLVDFWPRIKARLGHTSCFGVPKINMLGRRFGRLVVLYQADSVPRKYGKSLIVRSEIRWMCQCDCGTIKSIAGAPLRKKLIVSCGCYQKEIIGRERRTHGMCRTTEYNSYINAMRRCHEPKDKSYKNYGGRGIKFNFENFEQFFAEIGPKPKGTTLDRIDNNGHYEPGNVQWATPKEQSNNTRRKRIESFSNEELVIEVRRRGWKLLPENN